MAMDQAIALNKEMKQVINEIPSNKNSIAVMNAWEAKIQIMLGNCDQAALILEQTDFEEIEDRYMFEISSFSYVGIYRVSQTPIRVYLDFLELTRARVCLCKKQYSSGIEIIDKILDRISAGSNSRYQVEALIIKSLLLLQMGMKQQAVDAFQKAVALASREDYIQVFLNEASSIHPLIDTVRKNPSGDIEQRVFILKLWESLQGKIRKQQRKLAGT